MLVTMPFPRLLLTGQVRVLCQACSGPNGSGAHSSRSAPVPLSITRPVPHINTSIIGAWYSYRVPPTGEMRLSLEMQC
jgi:hypothetical protein